MSLNFIYWINLSCSFVDSNFYLIILFDYLYYIECTIDNQSKNFENDKDYESTLESFIPKIKGYLETTPTSDIKAFINTYENLLRQHIIKEQSEENKHKFTEELTKKYCVYVLRRIIPEHAKCPFLEEIFKSKEYNSLDQIRDLVTVKVDSREETKKMNKIEITTASKTHETGISGDTHAIVEDPSKNEQYCEIISLAIFKTANQLLKSKQKLEKVKSLKGIVNNNLNNIANSKTTSSELAETIKSDRSIVNKTINTMTKLQLIDVSEDFKIVKMYEHKFEDFAETTFDIEDFKQKVASKIKNSNI